MSEISIYLPITILENWDKNPRSITKDEFERLKYRLQSMEQIRPLLVTPNHDEEMPGYIVLGGNMRLRAMRELGVAQVWCTIVDFEEREGQWYAKVGDKISQKGFITKEDAMMEYSLLDNERSGYYDADILSGLMPEFNIDWDFNVDLKAPQSLEKLVANIAPEDTNVEMPSESLGLNTEQSTPVVSTNSDGTVTASTQPFTYAERLVKCPECESVFDPRKHPNDTNNLS